MDNFLNRSSRHSLITALIAMITCGLSISMLTYGTEAIIVTTVCCPHTQSVINPQHPDADRSKCLLKLRNEQRTFEGRKIGWPFVYLERINEPLSPLSLPASDSERLSNKIQSRRFEYQALKWSQLLLDLAIPISVAFALVCALRFLQRNQTQPDADGRRMTFGIRTLLIATFVVAIGCSLAVLDYKWRSRHTIIHSSRNATVVLPSGAKFQTNHWYSKTTAPQNMNLLVQFPTDQYFLVDEEASYRTAVMAVGNKSYEAIVEQSTHFENLHEYWIRPGEQVDAR